MGEVELPYVTPAIGIESALDAMRREGRSGLVTTMPDGRPALFTDIELIDALRERGDLSIGAINPVSHAVTIPEELPQRDILQHAIESGREALFGLMDKFGADYAIAVPSRNMVSVVTAREDLMSALGRAVVVCRCTKDPSHVWRPAQLTGGKCSIDGEPVNCG